MHGHPLSWLDIGIVWRTRDALDLDNVPGGVGSPGDNIIFDISATNPGQSGFESQASASGFGHPVCLGADDAADNAAVVAEHPIEPVED